MATCRSRCREAAAGAAAANFDFSGDQLAIRDAVEAICSDFGADYWLERDRDGRWPSEFCEAFARGVWRDLRESPEGVFAVVRPNVLRRPLA